jgi:hypothetical protein
VLESSQIPAGPTQPPGQPGPPGGGSGGGSGGGAGGSGLVPNEKKEKTWIGLLVKDFLGNPRKNEPFKISLNTGQTFSGQTNNEGKARFEGVEPDSGTVTLPKVPELAAFSPAPGPELDTEPPPALQLAAAVDATEEEEELKFFRIAPPEDPGEGTMD